MGCNEIVRIFFEGTCLRVQDCICVCVHVYICVHDTCMNLHVQVSTCEGVLLFVCEFACHFILHVDLYLYLCLHPYLYLSVNCSPAWLRIPAKTTQE